MPNVEINRLVINATTFNQVPVYDIEVGYVLRETTDEEFQRWDVTAAPKYQYAAELHLIATWSDLQGGGATRLLSQRTKIFNFPELITFDDANKESRRSFHVTLLKDFLKRDPWVNANINPRVKASVRLIPMIAGSKSVDTDATGLNLQPVNFGN